MMGAISWWTRPACRFILDLLQMTAELMLFCRDEFTGATASNTTAKRPNRRSRRKSVIGL